MRSLGIGPPTMRIVRYEQNGTVGYGRQRHDGSIVAIWRRSGRGREAGVGDRIGSRGPTGHGNGGHSPGAGGADRALCVDLNFRKDARESGTPSRPDSPPRRYETMTRADPILSAAAALSVLVALAAHAASLPQRLPNCTGADLRKADLSGACWSLPTYATQSCPTPTWKVLPCGAPTCATPAW